MTKNIHLTLRITTLLLVAAIVLSMTYIYALFNPAQGAALTVVSDVISTSQPSVDAQHTITFTVTTAMVPDDSRAIVIEFDNETPDAFNLTDMADGDGDVDMTIDGAADEILAAVDCTGAEDWAAVFAIGTPDTLTVTACTEGPGLGVGEVIEFQIGTHSAAGVNDITNPAVGSYAISITTDDDGTLGAGEIDQGETRVMILAQVAVTARVNTNLTCIATTHAEDVGSVLGVTTDTTGANCGFTNDGTLSDTVLDFDFVCPDPADSTDREFIGQSLTVATNATFGFLWTVEQDQNLLSATGDDINLFIDAGATATPTDWVQPATTLGSPDTYGHYGILSDDTNLEVDTSGGDADDFDDTGNASCAASPCFAGNIATARNIFAHTGPADALTADEGQADWGVAIEISSLQEAAEDYSNTLTHICTPTF